MLAERHVAGVTEDGRYAVIYSLPGSGGLALTVLDLTRPNLNPRAVVEMYADFEIEVLKIVRPGPSDLQKTHGLWVSC